MTKATKDALISKLETYLDELTRLQNMYHSTGYYNGRVMVEKPLNKYKVGIDSDGLFQTVLRDSGILGDDITSTLINFRLCIYRVTRALDGGTRTEINRPFNDAVKYLWKALNDIRNMHPENVSEEVEVPEDLVEIISQFLR